MGRRNLPTHQQQVVTDRKQQGQRHVPCQPRTYCPLCLRSHRLCRLPNHSVCVDGRTICVKRPLLQLSSGAWEWISRERVYNPKIPPNPAFIFGAAVFSGRSTPMCSALKMCYSSTYLYQIVC